MKMVILLIKYRVHEISSMLARIENQETIDDHQTQSGSQCPQHGGIGLVECILPKQSAQLEKSNCKIRADSISTMENDVGIILKIYSDWILKK